MPRKTPVATIFKPSPRTSRCTSCRRAPRAILKPNRGALAGGVGSHSKMPIADNSRANLRTIPTEKTKPVEARVLEIRRLHCLHRSSVGQPKRVESARTVPASDVAGPLV